LTHSERHGATSKGAVKGCVRPSKEHPHGVNHAAIPRSTRTTQQPPLRSTSRRGRAQVAAPPYDHAEGGTDELSLEKGEWRRGGTHHRVLTRITTPAPPIQSRADSHLHAAPQPPLLLAGAALPSSSSRTLSPPYTDKEGERIGGIFSPRSRSRVSPTTTRTEKRREKGDVSMDACCLKQTAPRRHGPSRHAHRTSSGR
jgi:hypothetical protein